MLEIASMPKGLSMPNLMDLPANPKSKNSFKTLNRRGLERLDLLLLAIESLDINGSQAMLWNAKRLGLNEAIPNRVELWKHRCHNPLRRASRRGKLKPNEIEALITIVCCMSERLYPLIHQLLSSNEPIELNKERWLHYQERLKDLIEERMNISRSAVKQLIDTHESYNFNRELLVTLAFCVGSSGTDRLRATLLDPI